MRAILHRYGVIVLAIVFLSLVLDSSLAQQAGRGPGAGRAGTTLTTFETDDFSGSGICAMCHSSLVDEAGNDVSNDAQWRSTMMANASKDPLWQAKISAEVALNPHVQDIIEEKCSRCHMGMARYQALADGTAVGVLDQGFLDPAHYLHEAAMDGVSCTLCHQIQSDNLGSVDSYTGKYMIDTLTVAPNRLIFGPYEQPFQNPMRQNAGFLPAFGSQMTDSAHCGTCHTLYTPALDKYGNDLQFEFPEQTTYLEWKHTGMLISCQDCHLPKSVGSVVISNRPPNLAGRTPFGQHHYVGGNTFMVDLLKNNADTIGITADAAHLDDTIARTFDQLEQNTANLMVRASRTADDLLVSVEVENLTGHKLPSGLPSRRSWLHVVVKDTHQNIVFESGKPLTDGRIEGNNAEDADPSTYEMHHKTITSSEQVQIYEPIMHTYEGDVTYTLLRAYSYVKDNRLLPAGFDKKMASDDIAVRGLAADDEDFIGGTDQVTYKIDVAGVVGQLNVTVELLYQTLSFPFINDLARTNTDLVSRFMAMYEPAANVPVLLSGKQLSVQ